MSNSDGNPNPALPALRQLTGKPTAEFHDGQAEAVKLLEQGGQSVICVQRTGWGKSAVYFLTTHLMRTRGAGPTIIISPLLALMRNQIAAARRLEIHAETINISNEDDWGESIHDFENGSLDVLIISPERLANRDFMAVAEKVIDTVGLFVVDEAHCISDWGHDFRPNYRRLKPFIARLPESASVLCTTATANDRVVADIHEQLTSSERPVTEIRGALERESLRLEVVDVNSRERKLAWLATHLWELEGSGIVYCSTIRDTELVQTWLVEDGVKAGVYHGGISSEERLSAEAALMNNGLKVLVATPALGMGYDKPDLGFVVHFQCPGSAVAYYQQVGRAGRALDQADGILLRGEEDFHIQDFFINTAIPPRHSVQELFEAFGRVGHEPASLPDLQTQMNFGKSRILAMLTMLEVEGAVERDDGQKWNLVNPDWPYDDERFNELTSLRKGELQRMRDYGNDGTCLMQFLRKELDDPEAGPCGRCASCSTGRFESVGDKDTISRAAKFFRSRIYEIKPRRRWEGRRSGLIPAEYQAELGIAISRYADGAYGDLVREGKYRDDLFPNELVEVAADRIAEWKPSLAISWVAAVPSLAHPELVPDFARRLADALALPFVSVVSKSRQTRPQKEMENSYQQACNVFEAFDVDQAKVIDGPVLLVDDMCDSRWTMTEIAFLLREAGAGPVFPFALSDSSNR